MMLKGIYFLASSSEGCMLKDRRFGGVWVFFNPIVSLMGIITGNSALFKLVAVVLCLHSDRASRIPGKKGRTDSQNVSTHKV